MLVENKDTATAFIYHNTRTLLAEAYSAAIYAQETLSYWYSVNVKLLILSKR